MYGYQQYHQQMQRFYQLDRRLKVLDTLLKRVFAGKYEREGEDRINRVKLVRAYTGYQHQWDLAFDALPSELRGTIAVFKTETRSKMTHSDVIGAACEFDVLLWDTQHRMDFRLGEIWNFQVDWQENGQRVEASFKVRPERRGQYVFPEKIFDEFKDVIRQKAGHVFVMRFGVVRSESIVEMTFARRDICPMPMLGQRKCQLEAA